MKYVYNFSTDNLDLVSTSDDFFNDFLKLDQTTPQTMTGLADGYLKLTGGVIGSGAIDLSGYVPTSRTLTINGTSYDLSADRSWTITDANLSTTDVTTNNASSTKHGFLPKLENSGTKYLRDDGTWQTVSGGSGSPGGADTNIQFNDGGAFAGDADFTWNKTTNVLGITGDITFGSGGTRTIGVAQSTSVGDELILRTANAAGTGNSAGGKMSVLTGDAVDSSTNFGGAGGAVSISTGKGGIAGLANPIVQSGSGGAFNITTGSGANITQWGQFFGRAGNGGAFNVILGVGGSAIMGAGSGSADAGQGGAGSFNGGLGGSARAGGIGGSGGGFTFTGGQGGVSNLTTTGTNTGGVGGSFNMYGGTGGDANSGPGAVAIIGGAGGSFGIAGGRAGNGKTGGLGGNLILVGGQGGYGTTLNGNGGNVYMSGGRTYSTANGTVGNIYLAYNFDYDVSNGNVGVGLKLATPPTARLHIAAGTAKAGTAPIKLTTGTLLTNAEAGAIEFLTDKFYATITTGTARKELTLNDSALTSGKYPIATTNGRLTDGVTPLSGTKVYYVSDSSGGAVTRKLTFTNGILTAES